MQQSPDTPVTKILLADDAAELGLLLSELVKLLEAVDEKAPTATLNETSISDNNGGRILL